MFQNLCFKSILSNFRDKEFIIWIILFPVMLSTLFYFTFSSLDEVDRLQVIPIAIIDNENYKQDLSFSETINAVSKKGEDQLFDTTFVSNKEKAKQLLKDNKISAYIQVIDGEPSFTVREDGLNQTIIKRFLDQYLQTKSSMEHILAQQPQQLNQISSLIQNETFTKEISISKNAPSNKVNYFYALLAMVCMYSGIQGISVVSHLQANLSPIGARKTVSPVKRWKLVLADLIAGIIVQWMAIFVVIFYIHFVLKVNFGPQLFPVLLIGAIGCLTGIAFGMMIAIPKKMKMAAKTALLISITMVCCFLSGLMTSGINYTVAQKAPLLSWINPAARITDAFYCLYYYDTYEQFLLNILILLIMTVLMFAITIFFIRRQQHESI